MTESAHRCHPERTYCYDALGRRRDVVYEGEAFSANHLFKWDYNHRSELTDAHRHQGTDPDQPGNRYADHGDFEFKYDNIGNRDDFKLFDDQDTLVRDTQYTANDLNQYESTTGPSDSYTYDDDGNLIDDGTFEYTWDMENRLIAIEPKTAEDESLRATFKYDYMGRRVRKTVEQYDEGQDTWTEITDQLYIYDGWNVTLVLDADSGSGYPIQQKYTWGLDLSGQSGNFTTAGIHGAGGIAGLLAVEETSGTYAGDSYWYLYDANGNVGQLVENDTGYPITAHYEYDPYGRRIAAVDTDSSGYVDNNPFRFSTKWLDWELADTNQAGAIGNEGLYYYGYRYYSPELGRWINRDPIGEGGGINLYSLLSNGAQSSVDLLGLAEYRVGVDPPPNSYQPDIDASTASYNTWSRTLADHAWIAWQGVKVRAAIAGGKARGMGNAADFLAHFKNNVGTKKSANVKQLIEDDENAENRFKADIDDALEYIEHNADALGQSIVTTEDYSIDAIVTDWVYTLGSYRTWAQAENITCNDGVYSMTFTIHLRDNYDWELDSALGAGGLPWGGHILYDADMAKLHRFGAMQEFEVGGSYTVDVTWKKGERMGSGAQVQGSRRR